MKPPQPTRTQSFEHRGRSVTVRNHEAEEQIKLDHQFRPAEVVKNIQRAPDNLHNDNSRSRDGSIARLDQLRDRKTGIERHRSPSSASIQYKTSKLNSSARYKNPMSAYNSNDNIDTIVPNHSNILYQKYQRPSIVSRTSENLKTPIVSSVTPKSNKSIPMNDMVPAFENLKIEIDHELQDENHDGKLDTTDFDNKFLDSNPISLKSESENSSINSNTILVTGVNQLNDGKEDPLNEETTTSSFKPVEKYGRIQQRVNYLKQMNEEKVQASNGRWTTHNFQQKLFLESLSNDLRSLKRTNHNPLYNTLERTNQNERKVLDSSASISSQSLLRNFDPMKHTHHSQLHHKRSTTFQSSQKPKRKEVDINRLKDLLAQSQKIAEQMWTEDEEKTQQYAHNQPSVISSEYERGGNKSSGETLSSSYSSDNVKLVTQTYQPKDLQSIKESFGGYEINNGDNPSGVVEVRNSKPHSPLTQRLS